jgi:LPS-assembly protein
VLVRIIDNWAFGQTLQWDSASNEVEQFTTLISFKSDANHIANLEYRYRPQDSRLAQEETRVSFVWPINYRWKALGYWNFDLNNHSTIELASGLEYENCCLIVRTLNQKWIRRTGINDYESANKQSIELQLKGLGNLSNQFSDYFKGKVPGYSN